MLHELHFAVHREPVGMNVPEAHEDGNHQAAVVEIRRIVYFFYDHNLAVGWSHHQILGVLYVEVAGMGNGRS